MKTIRYFWKTIVYNIIIYVLCFLPGSTFDSIKTFKFSDKIIHLLIYFGFALLFYESLAKLFGNWKLLKKHVLLIFFLAAIQGIFIEIIQHYFILNRSWDVGDIAANLSGAFIFLILSPTFKNRLILLSNFRFTVKN